MTALIEMRDHDLADFCRLRTDSLADTGNSLLYAEHFRIYAKPFLDLGVMPISGWAGIARLAAASWKDDPR
jgi:hypothetical protein